MKKIELTLKDLKEALTELGERFRNFKDDDLFVLWFLRAYVTDNEDQAAKAISGGSNDKGVDALLIDDASRSVFIVQGKYRQSLGKKSESRSDVIAFAELARVLNTYSDEQVKEYLKDADLSVADALQKARKKVQKEKYRTWLYFVTTGKVSSTIRKDTQQMVRQASRVARIEIIDGRRAMLLFGDYLDGVAPPVPALELEMEAGAGVTVNGIAQRFDHSEKVESWVFSMKGDAVGKLFDRAGVRLFARNIRGFMGLKTAVNRGMIATLQTEPERFFYFNNGITIVCDEAEQRSSQGRDLLHVGNPQIINGQQTTRTLAEYPKQAAKASVLVKVIRVPRDGNGDSEVFDSLVSKIVAGTNWQNAIKPSDLMSNDRLQIDLERSLRKVGYLYLRKRQSKSEARRITGRKQFYVVTKEELAQAVAGCDLDPYIIRSGREKLFTEELYSQAFPNSDPDYYLPRYRLMREVTYAAKGVPERGYAKWMVLNFMWSHIAPLVRGRRKCLAFRRMCEVQEDSLVVPLNQIIIDVFIEALKYYRANRGKGDSAIDVSQFFKNRKRHHKLFAEYWDQNVTKSRQSAFSRRLEKVKTVIADCDG